MRHSSSSLEALYRLSSRNRDSVRGTHQCGCFHCLRTFEASAITQWAPEADGMEVTALCPLCGADSVLPARDGAAVDTEMLSAMHAYWYGSASSSSGAPNLGEKASPKSQPLLRRLAWDLWESRRTVH